MSKRSLKRSLIHSFLLISLLPTLIGLCLFYQIMADNSRQQLLQRSQRDLEQVTQQIQAQVDQVSDLTNWITHNAGILNLLRRSSEQSNQYDMVFHTVLTELENQLSYRALTPYLQSLFLRGVNGLDIRAGSEAALNSEQTIYSLLYETSYDATYWGGRRSNAAILTRQEHTLPYCYPIYDSEGALLGWVVALFSEELFTDRYGGFTDGADTPAGLYNGNGELLCGNQIKKEEQGAVTEGWSAVNGWKMDIYILKATLWQVRVALLATVALLGGLIAISLTVLSWRMNQMLILPIDRMTTQVKLIAAGRFLPQERWPEITELDELGNRILDMQRDIERLMEQERRREQDKQQLEIQVLQAQMNPHFLYNTLNTIKIMAIMQGKKSICDMIEALGKILHANLLTQQDSVTIEQELELLKSYMYIQNMRQKGRLQWRVDGVDRSLLQQQIPKFLLQPLVENAIVHGLPEPMDDGCITISGTHGRDSMCLAVEDNGVGMTQERLERLRDELQDLDMAQSTQGHGIALRNVQRRIRLHYGSRYGISVQSTVGKGCRVEVILPYSIMEGGALCSGGES